MGKIKRYACIIMLFGMSMQVLAQANDAHEGETGAATIVSLVASLVALSRYFCNLLEVQTSVIYRYNNQRTS